MAGNINLYIPREIRNFILENRTVKLYLWRLVRTKMYSTYSIFTTSDYIRMVKYLLEESVACDDPKPYTPEYFANLEDKWLQILEKEFKRFIVDIDGYSKIILLLTILENIQNKNIIQNRFFLSMYEIYNKIWRRNKPKSIRTVPNFYKVIITLKESKFYKIKLVSDGLLGVSSQKKRIWDKETALNYIDYSYLNDELFDLMFRDSFRMRLRNQIKIYLQTFDIIR